MQLLFFKQSQQLCKTLAFRPCLQLTAVACMHCWWLQADLWTVCRQSAGRQQKHAAAELSGMQQALDFLCDPDAMSASAGRTTAIKAYHAKTMHLMPCSRALHRCFVSVCSGLLQCSGSALGSRSSSAVAASSASSRPVPSGCSWRTACGLAGSGLWRHCRSHCNLDASSAAKSQQLSHAGWAARWVGTCMALRFIVS